MHETFLVETETLMPKTEAETEALTIQAEARLRPSLAFIYRARDRDEAEAYQFRGETEPRHHCASRQPRDRGVKTEAWATTHIHIIPRTDVVLKRCGEA